MKVSEVDWEKTSIFRGGIIPFYDYKHIRLYAFSIENGSGSLSDFGGHIETGVDKDLLDAIIREYYEESFGIFGDITRDSIQDCEVLKGSETFQILLPINLNPRETVNLFQQKLLKIQPSISHEAQAIIWLSKDQIKLIIQDPNHYQDNDNILRMYWRIQEAFRNCYKDLV